LKTPNFDPVIHAPLRLQICAMLSQMKQAEFQVVRDELEVSDSVLSKHLSQLSEAGYVNQVKLLTNGRQRTTLSLSSKGRRAFAEHVATLQDLASLASREP
jgi:DNA-binding MarR family transcriptional regulator